MLAISVAIAVLGILTAVYLLKSRPPMTQSATTTPQPAPAVPPAQPTSTPPVQLTTNHTGRRWRKFFEISLVLLGIAIAVYLAYLLHSNWNGEAIWSWLNSLAPREFSDFKVVAYAVLSIILLILLFKAVQLLLTGKKGWGTHVVASILLLFVGPFVIELADEVWGWAMHDDVKVVLYEPRKPVNPVHLRHKEKLRVIVPERTPAKGCIAFSPFEKLNIEWPNTPEDSTYVDISPKYSDMIAKIHVHPPTASICSRKGM